MTAPTTATVTLTGAGGQIGYALLFRIASGQLLGPDTRIRLHLLEIPGGLAARSHRCGAADCISRKFLRQTQAEQICRVPNPLDDEIRTRLAGDPWVWVAWRAATRKNHAAGPPR